MHASAVNFALGFFGWPLNGKYEQVITIEAADVSPHHIIFGIRLTHLINSSTTLLLLTTLVPMLVPIANLAVPQPTSRNGLGFT
jgi:hypothetical protein